ncbi:potassium channel family protein [Methanobrevibacter sp.]|uniref:potassium channel family protein n=1 Tax=Methanobrevibacter sp. TaxID=66852 RepID=UPI00388F9B32
MKLFKNESAELWYNRILPLIIIADFILITVSLILNVSESTMNHIEIFDFIVCIILLGEFFYSLMKAPSKKKFLLNRDNILLLIASIPFDFIIDLFMPGNFPGSIFGYLRILRLIRVISFARMGSFMEFFKKTEFHKIIIAIVIIILAFTALFYVFGTTYSPFDYFYFVIVTLTTVGYGDITPQTYNDKILTMILILIGIVIFSTITASISSYLTDTMLESDDDGIDDVKKSLEEKSEKIESELDAIRKENRELREEIKELKEIIENK